VVLLAADVPKPEDYKTAMASNYKNEWTVAIAEELESHRVLHTWDEVIIKEKAPIIPTKYVYKIYNLFRSSFGS
jgi:hypothetical protein